MIPSQHPRIFIAYLALLAAAPLPLGSNRDWAWPVLCAAVFLLAAQLSFQQQRPLGGAAMRQLTLLLLLACWTLIQWTGLPPLLSPAAIEAAPTRNALLLTLAYAGFAYLTLQLVCSARSATWVIQVLVVGATLQVVLALYQLIEQSILAGATNLLALFRASGTYASPNHLAGHLHQVLGLALGLLLLRQAGNAQAPWREQLLAFMTGPGLRLRLLILVLAAGMVMTLSRGGNLALLSAIVVATLVDSLARRRVNRFTLVLAVSVLLLDVAVIGQHYGLDRLQQRLENTTLQSEFRDDLISYHLDMIRDHGISGVGAGNYAALVPQYRDERIPARLTHAENDYLQFAIELGIPGCLCLLLFVLGALRQQWRLLRDPACGEIRGIAFGCLLATVAMLIHSLVDFNLRIPANALLFVLTLTVPFGLYRTSGPGDRGPA